MYSKEKQQEHISRIRRILVIDSKASIPKVQEKLESSKKDPLHLDKDYVNKLINRIRKEKAKRFDKYTIDKVLVGFQDEVEELKKTLWVVINNNYTTQGERVSAIREIRNSSKDLFDKMFDSGVFERNLGKMKREEELNKDDKELLEKAIKYAGDIGKEDNGEPAIPKGTGD